MGREISISFALNAALGSGFRAVFQSAATSARNVASAIRDMEKTPVGQLGASMARQREKIKGLAGSLKEARATLATLQSQAQASGTSTKLLATQIRQAEDRVNNLTEASAGMLALADQAKKTVDDAGNAIVDSAGRQTNALRKQMDTVANYEGTVKTVAKKQMDTTKGSLLMLSSAWQDVGISVGNLFLPCIRAAAGALSGIANVISGVVNRFPTLSKGIALVVGGVLAFTAASVGIGLVLNLVRTSLNGFRGGLLRLSAFFSNLGSNLAGIWPGIWSNVCQVASDAKASFISIWEDVSGFFSRLFEPVKNTFAALWNGITGYFGSIFGGVANIAATVWGGIAGLITRPFETAQSIWNGITAFFSGLWQGIIFGASSIGRGILAVFSGAKNAVMAIWNGITAYYKWLFGGIADIAGAIWNGIAILATRAVEIIKGVWNGIASFFSGLWQGIISGASSIGQGIFYVFSNAKDGVIGIWNGITGFFSTLWGWLADSATNLWNNVCALAAWAFDGVIGVWNGAVAFFSAIVNGVSAAFAWAHDSVIGIWQGVSEFFGSIGQGISGCFSGVWQGIVDMAAGAWEGIAGIWNGAIEFFSGIVDGIFGVFQPVFDWLKEKFAWVLGAVDAVKSAVGSITGAVKGAWNAAFGDGEKKESREKTAAVNGEKAAATVNNPSAAPAANGQKVASVKPTMPPLPAHQPSAASNAQATAQKPVLPERKESAAPNAQNAQNTQASQGRESLLGPDWKPGAAPEPPKEKATKKKASSGGSGRSQAGASGEGGGGGRTGVGAKSDSGPVRAAPLGAKRPYGAGLPFTGTVVTLDSGNEIKTQFFPAASSNAAANANNAAASAAPAQEVGAIPAKLTVEQEFPSQPDRDFSAPPSEAKRPYGGDLPLAGTVNAMSALKSLGIGGVIGQGLQAGIGMAKSVFGIGQNPRDSAAAQAARTPTVQTTILSATPERKAITGAVGAPALQPALSKAGSALQTAGQPALPQAPAMIAKSRRENGEAAWMRPAAQRERSENPAFRERPLSVAQDARPKGISIDLTQNFDLIAQDAAAIRKVMESLKPDFEALVRRALEKIQSDKRRTAYAQ